MEGKKTISEMRKNKIVYKFHLLTSEVWQLFLKHPPINFVMPFLFTILGYNNIKYNSFIDMKK